MTAIPQNAFAQCPACAEKLGTCTVCRHNRELISRLQKALEETLYLADDLCTKIWPTTATPRRIEERLAELRKEFDL